MGLPPMVSEKPGAPDIDRAGHTLWHYWAESPRPIDLWSSAVQRILHLHRNQKSSHGEHPWHLLALRGQLDAIRQWASEFENPTTEGADLAGVGHNGDSVLMRAVWSANDALVAWLLDNGATPHMADQHGLTPLMVAAHRCQPLTIQLLLHHGADPELRDEKGRTALHHAAQCEHADIYAMVEDCGGDATCTDQQGQTPVQMLEKTTRTPQQAQITRVHWERRYQAKLAF